MLEEAGAAISAVPLGLSALSLSLLLLVELLDAVGEQGVPLAFEDDDVAVTEDS